MKKETPNNRLHTNPAIASRLDSGHHRRGVGEPYRSAASSVMRIFTLLITVSWALLTGCTHGKEMRFSKGQGDIGPFILEHALKRGARPVTTNDLPAVGEEWRYSEDEHGVVLHLPRERFDQVVAFLRHTFGTPAQEPTDTTTGGKLGWYAAKTIGIGLQFGYDAERTQVIVLRLQPASEILKRLPDALEQSR